MLADIRLTLVDHCLVQTTARKAPPKAKHLGAVRLRTINDLQQLSRPEPKQLALTKPLYWANRHHST